MWVRHSGMQGTQLHNIDLVQWGHYNTKDKVGLKYCACGEGTKISDRYKYYKLSFPSGISNCKIPIIYLDECKILQRLGI